MGAHAYTDASILLPGSLNIFKRFSCQNPSTNPCLSDSKIYEFRSWKAKLRRKKNTRSIATLEIGNPILPKENFPMRNISKQAMNVGWHMCAHNVTAINPIRLSDMQGWQLFVDPLLHSVPTRIVHRNSSQRCCETAHNWFCGQKSSVSEICCFFAETYAEHGNYHFHPDHLQCLRFVPVDGRRYLRGSLPKMIALHILKMPSDWDKSSPLWKTKHSDAH